MANASMPSAMASRTVKRGSSAEPGVLHDDLHLAPVGLETASADSDELDAAKPDVAAAGLAPVAGWLRPTVVLPHPDSPTSASVSPGKIVRSTPSTARTWPRHALQDAAADRKPGAQPAHLEQRIGAEHGHGRGSA